MSDNYDDYDNDTNTKRKSCCRRCCIWSTALLGIGLIVGGALWYALPEDKKSLITVPGLRNTQSPTVSPAPTVPPAPTVAPTASWQFNQCGTTTTTTTTTSSSSSNSDNTPCCNGLPEACNLRANQAMYAYMHNAVHTRDDGFLFPWNHEQTLEQALVAGYRALELDVSRCDDDIVFYHGLCGLGVRDPVQVLNNVGDFITQNPNEVVFLFLQMPENVNTVSLADFDTVVVENSNLADRLYAHPDTATPWPTLGELITAQQNVILFYFNQPACRVDDACPTPAWNYWFEYGMETEYDFGTLDALDDTVASCTPNFDSTPRDFYRVNSFVTLPSQRASRTLNSYEYAQTRTRACQDQVATQFGTDTGQQEGTTFVPNFYAVDFWSLGEVPRWVQDENKARAANAT